MTRGIVGPIEWIEGDPLVRRALDALAGSPDSAAGTLRSNDRRTLLRATLALDVPRTERATPLAVAIKVHHLATGRHPLRERMKRAVGRSPALREWRALRALADAGVGVPTPLAYGRDAAGDELVVAAFVDGPPVAPHDVERLGDALAALVRAHRRHGDLHLGNLVVDGEGRVVLLDPQRSRPCRSAREALLDFASLELSCRRAGWPAGPRMRLRDCLAEALDAAGSDRATGAAVTGADFDDALRRFAADHLRGRARRRLRAGRHLRAIRRADMRGWCDASLGEDAVFEAFSRAERSSERRSRRDGRDWIAPLETEHARWIVKRSAIGSFGRRTAAALFGSHAARAFRKGMRDQLLLRVAARPLACVEAARFGWPRESWLLLERVGDADLDQYRPATATEAYGLAEAVGDWLADLHSAGLSHADFKGSNVRVAGSAEGPRFRLVDLEDLIGPRRLTDDERLAALAALNASLEDGAFDCAARTAALRRYLARVPFADPALDEAGAQREIARRSLARAHRFRGEASASPDAPGVRRP